MTFITDDQTLADLGIMGRQDRTGVFDLYNQTFTRGGEVLLKTFFRQPLTDCDEINRKSRLLASFAAAEIGFPFDVTQLDIVEKYLLEAEPAGGTVAGVSRQQGGMGERELQQGVMGVIRLLHTMRDFVRGSAMREMAAYEQERGFIEKLLAGDRLRPVMEETARGKLAYTALMAYDTLFRVQQRAVIRTLLEQAYLLDVYISVAQLARKRGFAFPQAYEKESTFLRLEGVYHPELSHPVTNDLSMDARKNTLFLTGANMAGKSTFLRAVSTAVYIAHMGFPVAAGRMEFSAMDGMYTTINLPDNLMVGASHFYNEVLRVKKVASGLQKGQSLFVVFDELFRGTNVRDAHEATVAVVSKFMQQRQSLFILSSHIVEAGEDLRDRPGIAFRFVPTKMNGHTPVYTYRLEEGITEDRHGMIIIRNEGILDILARGRKHVRVLPMHNQ